MLRLIPPPLHRLAYRIADALRRRWWRLREPDLNGCRVLALDGEGRILLVRHSYGRGHWMPPGGGIDRGESPLAAAVRELREETGCCLERPCELTMVERDFHGARNRVHVIAGHTSAAPVPDGREIVEARFFAPDALPGDMPDFLGRSLPEWLAQLRET